MTPEQLKQARLNAGLTQEEAAALVYIATSTWRSWEAKPMLNKSQLNNFKARYELFEYKVAELITAENKVELVLPSNIEGKGND